MLTLYDDAFSPYARKVRIALYEKGVEFERIRALHDCNRTDFLHVNPRAEVPALAEGELRLFDSTIICEYVEDRWPAPPLYPRDPAARADVRLIEDLADTQLDAALYAIAIVQARGETHEGMRAAAQRDLVRLYGELERRLARAPYLCGEYSIADIAVAPHLMAAAYLGLPVDGDTHPRLLAWLARVQERPAVRRDNEDVLATLSRHAADGTPLFDPWRVQWRSERLEWVVKHGFTDWFMAELRAGRAFFPLS